MTNFAKPELCQKLYEVSGWKIEGEPMVIPDNYPKDRRGYYNYTLGYLIRKLPQEMGVEIYSWDNGARWTALIGEGDAAKTSDTPENAVARLAVDLFDIGLLK